MFHRVKSETTPEEKTTAPEAFEEQNTLEIEEQAEEELAEDTTEETSSDDQTTDLDPQEEEAETMTTQAEDTKEPTSRPDIPAGTYGRSTQSAVRPGGYPGAYPGGVAYGAAAASSAQAEPTDRTLTIGAGITMSGEIESCDNLIVEGTVEAALKGARNLDIADSGTFYGTVEIEDAVIAGRFEGELTVTGRLVLRTGAIITGTIAYGELEVEAGAIIDGRLTPVAAQQAAAQSAPAKEKAKPAAPTAKVAKKDAQQEAANSEGALFAAKA